MSEEIKLNSLNKLVVESIPDGIKTGETKKSVRFGTIDEILKEKEVKIQRLFG